MSEQSMNNLPCEFVAPATAAAAAATAEPERMNLLELMELCADICLAHPLCLLEIVEQHCAETQTEICVAPLMTEIMSLRLSPFGQRFAQIH